MPPEKVSGCRRQTECKTSVQPTTLKTSGRRKREKGEEFKKKKVTQEACKTARGKGREKARNKREYQ